MWGGAGGRERAAGGGAGRGRSGPGRGLLALSGTCGCGARQPSGRKPARTRYRRPSRLRRLRRHGQVGPGGPALDRGGAGRRDQREQLALVRPAGGRAGGRLGLGRGRAPGRAARPCSTLAPGGRRFLTALAFRLQDPPESWAKPHEGLLPHPPTSVPRSPFSRPSSGLSCVVRVRVCRGMYLCAVGRAGTWISLSLLCLSLC